MRSVLDVFAISSSLTDWRRASSEAGPLGV
jgi:hypothetical protein